MALQLILLVTGAFLLYQLEAIVLMPKLWLLLHNQEMLLMAIKDDIKVEIMFKKIVHDMA
jgi:hypothetical protein